MQPQPQSLQLLHSLRFLLSPQPPLSPTAPQGEQQARQLEAQCNAAHPQPCGGSMLPSTPNCPHPGMPSAQLPGTSSSTLKELWSKDRKGKGKDLFHFVPKSLPKSKTPQDMSNPKLLATKQGTKSLGMGFGRGLCASIRFPGLESKPSTVVLLQLLAQPHSPARPQECYSADLLPGALQQNSPWVSSARCAGQFL